MKNFSTVLKKTDQQGFTLVELLIVVIILAVLAAIVVPQFGSSTEDAKVSTLKADLSAMRNALEIYYQQHDSRYPGQFKETDGTAAAAGSTCEPAFVAQLTQYTDKNGKVSGTKDATYKYGPYIKGMTLPVNPFIDGATGSNVLCTTTGDTLTTAFVPAPVTAAGQGWLFYMTTGRIFANDGKTLNDTTTKTLSF